jgi:gluconolactonase
MYLTDPFYKRTWWDHTTMALPSEEVFYLSPDHKTLTRVTEDLKKPNGITGTPDGKTLYVSDIGAGQTWSYSIQPDGSLTNKTLFCSRGSDGMTIDAQGNLYLTGHGVFIYDKWGKQIGHIDVPEAWVGNLCFGGKDRKTLFLAASKGLYAIQMTVTGANAAK